MKTTRVGKLAGDIDSPVHDFVRFHVADDAIPIVMYVGNRQEYFERSLQALSKAARISETLLVVSHDAPSVEMFQTVAVMADFCSVLEVS